VVGKPRPTSLSIFINDEEVNEWNLNDLKIHAGGALTRLNGLGVGEHGDLIKIQVPASRLTQIFERAYSEGVLRVRFEIKKTARNRGGLMLFGRNAGKYGLDPEIRWVAADQ
jgi:predicted transcriptional regulator